MLLQRSTMLLQLMRSTRFFPSVLIALQLGAVMRYALAGAKVQAAYWLLAAGLNALVAFGMGSK